MCDPFVGDFGRLSLFIKGHDDLPRRRNRESKRAPAEEFRLAILEADRIHDRLPLHALLGRLS